MASASFTLRAVDQTRAAFASAQNNIDTTSNKLKAFKSSFAGRGLLEGLGIGTGLQLAQTVVNKIVEQFEKAADFAKEMEGYTKRSLEFTLRAIKAAQSPEQQMVTLRKEQEKIINARKELEKPVFFFAPAQPGFAFDESKKAGIRQAAQTPRQKEEIAKFIERENEIAEEMAKLRKEMAKVEADAIKSENDEKDKLQEAADKVALERRSRFNKTFNDAIKAQSDEDKETERTALERLNRFNKAFNDARIEEDSMQKLSDEYKNIADPSRVFILQLEEINKLASEGKLTIEEAARAVEDLTTAMEENKASRVDEELFKFFEEIDQRADRIFESRKKQNQIFADAGAMIAQGFEDAIISGQKLGEVVRSLGRDLVRLVFQQMVTQRLAKGIAVGLAGGGFAGFMAAGGPVSAGSSYVVGEEGPELFVPHASGTIVPNNKMGSGGGGAGGVTINYNIASGVSRAELVPILDQERRRLKAEIPDMVRRGGAYRAAFA
jgi:hypothetical protein